MYKVHHLNCVEIQSPAHGRAIGHCILLEVDKNRLILVDTGIGLLDTRKPVERLGEQLIAIIGFKFNEDWTAVKQIERIGLDPNNVTDCIITHMDPDHISGLADFPNAKVHVAEEEYANFKSGNQRYLEHQLDHRPAIKTYSGSDEMWYNFEARRVDIGVELDVYLVPLFGHTMGHCGVALKHDSKWLFYTGDAYYLRAELSDPRHPVKEMAEMVADDNILRLEALSKIKQLAEEHPEMEIFGYHDLEEFKKFF